MNRSTVACASFFAFVFLAGSAAAAPPTDDVLTPLDASEVRRDVRFESYEEPGDGAPLWLSVVGGLALDQKGYEGSAVLSIGGALDRFARGPAPSRAKEHDDPAKSQGSARPSPPARTPDATKAKLAHRSGDDDAPTSAETDGATPAAPPSRPAENEPPPVSPRLDGAFARGLVRAARARAREHETDERLDALATRARVSGLLPEVRVRVARVTSGTQALSPTEYDPTRVTASDGSGLWLEGRATFRLDRLVFADDEIALERLRAERDRMDRALVADVLAELALYQRGAARAADPTLADDDRVTGEITSFSAAAALDVLSDGWFSAHLPEGAR